MKKLIVCQCGETIRGKDDDELVVNVQKHADTVHGGMEVKREEVMGMAQPDPDA